MLYPPISVEDQNSNIEPQDQDLKEIYKHYFTDLTSEELLELTRSARPLLIVGASGTLGNAFKIICKERAIPYRALTRQELDITDIKAVEKTLSEINPWAVINASGYVRVDDAENEREACFHINVGGAISLAEVCKAFGIQYVTFSSDLVFDGRKKKPYVESDLVFPLNTYGKSKAVAEKEVLKLNEQALVIRTSSFFGPWDKYNWIIMALDKVANGTTVVMSNDQVFTATYVPDLVHATLDLLIDKEWGIWHITNPGEVTWVSMAKQAAEYVGLESEMIIGRKGTSKTKKPVYSVLGSEKGILLPKLESALKHFCDTVKKNDRMIEGMNDKMVR
jgi:dTDP-4-dehydrorhamnose reductase